MPIWWNLPWLEGLCFLIRVTRPAILNSLLQVKGGQELGAVGVLIYSDPRDDGTVTVENGYEA